MDLRLFRSFLEVAETRNFTRAAARIHLAQSALSQQISLLERDLGVRLFHRTSRSVTLTEAGTALVPLARDLLRRTERIRAEMDALAGLERGTLLIGLLQTPTPVFDIVDLLGTFRDAHPGIELHVTDAPSEVMTARVASGDLDLAIVGLAHDEVPADLDYVPLAVEPLVAVTVADGVLDGTAPEALATSRPLARSCTSRRARASGGASRRRSRAPG